MLTTLYSFCSVSKCADGSTPRSELIQASDGNLYGTTNAGGITNANCSGGCGTIFRVTPSGTLTTLHSFCAQPHCVDGTHPVAALVQATGGNFYHSTPAGGTFINKCQHGCGLLFRLSTGLGPFVKTLPTSGKLGASVIIMGTNLTGTTGVDFNAAATFTVVSNSEIQTTVPNGATTGFVTVTTPSGTLKCNAIFRVRP